MPAAEVAEPMRVAGQTVLEPGAPVVWFTFPGARHDIGRFHTADDRFTGYYANILTPVELDAGSEPDVWRTTDLFLDVFLEPSGAVHVLDRDELREAVNRGWIDETGAGAAELEAARLIELARHGSWPPALVDAWPLARARAVAGGAGRVG